MNYKIWFFKIEINIFLVDLITMVIYLILEILGIKKSYSIDDLKIAYN